MSVIGQKSDGSSPGKSKQYVVLEKNTYGALFRGYGEPKEYDNLYKPGEKVQKFSLSFLLFCDRNGQPLPQISSASKLITTNLFYDPVKGTTSSYFLFLHALHGRKMTMQELWEQPGPPDLDQFIGWPLALSVEPQSGNDNIERNKIISFNAATDPILALARKIHKSLVIEQSERDGHKYLASPKAEERELVAAGGAYTDNDFTGLDNDEIPF